MIDKYPWQLRQLTVISQRGSENEVDATVLSGNSVDGDLWQPRQRLHDLFERACDHAHRFRSSNSCAIEFLNSRMSFRQLDNKANQIARLLHLNNVQAGERLGILLDRSVYSHASVLGISKAGATYVPLDAGFPPDRIEYILRDSQVSLVLTLSEFAHLFDNTSVTVITLDTMTSEISALSDSRLSDVLRDTKADRTCYIIYTSGSTGRPKGVAISHENICSFLAAAVQSYGYLETDRVYQGMTMAFDFSVEELWVPLLSGATLIPAPSGMSLLGEDLGCFLKERHITAICCVPTLLATIDIDLPELRFLMVSGEASSQELLDRWCRPERRILNTYGPTEATVTATWAIMHSGDKVTIGGPLPGYSVVILCPDSEKALPLGESGELGIAGPGLAEGYVNLPEQTAKAFVPDFIGMPDNSSGRIYRTGDLAKINEHGQIEYEGRIDAQVKIRGYRIELTEIENVISQVNGVGPVAVSTYEPTPGQLELVAYYTILSPLEPVDCDTIHKAMITRLPPYMVPSYIEKLHKMPLLPSTKVNRKALPEPVGRRFQSTNRPFNAPKTDLEKTLSNRLATLLNVEQVSTSANFFSELGANSLILARYLSVLRREGEAASLSMKDVYQNPTIAELASVVVHRNSVQSLTTTIKTQPNTNSSQPEKAPRPPHRATNGAYIATAVAQLAYLVSSGFISAFTFIALLKWTLSDTVFFVVIARACFASGLMFFGLAILLIVIKWIAVGRCQPSTIPVWSFEYFRFWVAKIAILSNPLNLFGGTPVFNLFLRLLGAQVGRGAVLYCRPPICPDLVRIGGNTIIRQDTIMQGYVARDGYLHTGSIDIGCDCTVAESNVLDIFTSMGDGSKLGANSALPKGMKLNSGGVYQGTPAQPCDADIDQIGSTEQPAYNPTWYCASLFSLYVIVIPALLVLIGLTSTNYASGSANADVFLGKQQTIDQWILNCIGISLMVYLSWLLLLHIKALLLPRLINLFITSQAIHRLYGVQYALTRLLIRISKTKELNRLYGDSSLITHFLGALGYDLKDTTQTGSNFGTSQHHHSPFLNKFSRNTLVSDGLKLINMEVNTRAFRLSAAMIGANNYLGNLIIWPSAAKVGENCLVATKAAVPIDGPIRENTGILGSPSFEIPRSVSRDHRFDNEKKGPALAQNLKRKLRSNLATIAIYLTANWLLVLIYVIVISLLFRTSYMVNASTMVQASALTLMAIVSLFFIPGYILLACRAYLWWQPLSPLYCSLYDKRFWHYERIWKLSNSEYLVAFFGTPYKNFYSRLQGATLGARAFDDGSYMSEPWLVTIGDDCCLNHQTTLQSHSLEEGTFKSDHIHLGSAVNLDVHCFVHYGTQINDSATVLSNSFLMKGSRVENGETWFGNPAMAEDITGMDTSSIIPLHTRMKPDQVLTEKANLAALP